jgi:PhzF family phenazine biosynthesis protein
MSQAITVVDAFTDRPFAGNPAAVCVMQGPADEDWMRAVAAELNLSETAFLHPEADGHRLRWLTPAVEVDLCGHATLASAHVLWEEGHLDPSRPAIFHTRSGRLSAERDPDGIALDFPVKPCETIEAPGGLAEALGCTMLEVGRNALDLLVVAESAAVVRRLTPDFRKLSTLTVRGVIVTAPSDDPEYDFISRFFAPASGIDEDPVTGSAHCALGPYWGTVLGKRSLVGLQASRRGGTVGIRLEGDRVRLIGRAVTIWKGAVVGP